MAALDAPSAIVATKKSRMPGAHQAVVGNDDRACCRITAQPVLVTEESDARSIAVRSDLD
jgi:hypothetical protein